MAYAQELQITSDIVVHLLQSIAGYFEITGQYGDAFVLYKRALGIRNQNFGIDHVDSAGTIMGIGNAHQRQGNYDKAITQYQWALSVMC